MNIVIYSKPECIFCERSKVHLKNCHIEYKEIKLDPKTSGYTIDRDALFHMYNYKSFPLILIDDVFIGGYTNLINIVKPEITFDEDF